MEIVKYICENLAFGIVNHDNECLSLKSDSHLPLKLFLFVSIKGL